MTETVVLGGGCFWCTEAVFVQVHGVLDVESGYCNGQSERPSYEQVCTGQTGCAEVVKLVFDPQQVGLSALLELFLAIHDPTQLNRQGHDIGTQYRSGIYTTTPAQASVASEVLAQYRHPSGRPVVTEVLPLQHYWPAEPYHQDFFDRNPAQPYCLAVAAPKVAKLQRDFAAMVRPGL